MSKTVFVNGEMRVNQTQEENPGKKRVNKYIYLILTVFLGAFGIHKFYAGKIVSGILYLLFCWTLIPMFLSIFDFIKGAGEIKDTEDKIWI